MAMSSAMSRSAALARSRLTNTGSFKVCNSFAFSAFNAQTSFVFQDIFKMSMLSRVLGSCWFFVLFHVFCAVARVFIVVCVCCMCKTAAQQQNFVQNPTHAPAWSFIDLSAGQGQYELKNEPCHAYNGIDAWWKFGLFCSLFSVVCFLCILCLFVLWLSHLFVLCSASWYSQRARAWMAILSACEQFNSFESRTRWNAAL